LTKVSILIVEDEVIIAQSNQQLIINLGYNVIGIESTGEGAIRKVGENKPDLVLMDIKLKGSLNGIQVAKEIKQLYDIPVIFLTAYSPEEVFEHVSDIQSFGFVSKLIDVHELSSAIEIAFSKKQIEI